MDRYKWFDMNRCGFHMYRCDWFHMDRYGWLHKDRRGWFHVFCALAHHYLSILVIADQSCDTVHGAETQQYYCKHRIRLY